MIDKTVRIEETSLRRRWLKLIESYEGAACGLDELQAKLKRFEPGLYAELCEGSGVNRAD